MKPKIIAIIPAYNEATRINIVILAAKKYVDEVIVVDDGSTDNTVQVSRDCGALVVCHGENCGAGAATMTGIEAARLKKADIVVTLDADGQHDSNDMPSLLKPAIEGKADMVFANRFGQRNNIPFIRRCANGIGNIITFMATGKWVSDSQCGFKVFAPKALKEVNIRMSGFEFCTEIVREVVQNNWRIIEIPSKVVYSEYTMAKGQSFGKGIQTAIKILMRSFLR